ncbi:MAG: carbohydrate binding domain-containing protein [Candidatus Omnitrophota bacterium]|nr:carbohydrate binding domain-containing protein [Candidatus Omnitrophota bacterium]
MHRLFVLLLTSILTASLITGCGQSRQPQEDKKPIVVKTNDKVADISDIEDASGPEEAANVVAESAVDKAPDTQVTQAVNNTEAPAAPAAPKAEAPKYSDQVVAADFNSGEKPSNLGGNFGAWNKDPSDPTQWCKEGFDNVTRHGDTGFSMKLDYSVDSPNPAYNGFWMTLPNFDATKYDFLTLWVKGDSKAGYTTVFKIELKSANKQVGRFYVSNVGDQWQEISIPLSEFKGLIDRSSLTEFVIVFEDRMASNKKGVLYVDDIGFARK